MLLCPQLSHGDASGTQLNLVEDGDSPDVGHLGQDETVESCDHPNGHALTLNATGD